MGTNDRWRCVIPDCSDKGRFSETTRVARDGVVADEVKQNTWL